MEILKGNYKSFIVNLTADALSEKQKQTNKQKQNRKPNIFMTQTKAVREKLFDDIFP